MVGFKHTLCALLLTMVTGMAIAQNNTNSPYTRYGYGDLSDQSFGNSKAMGGIAFGLRDGAQINPTNPASYTAIDSLTFLFEGGVSLQNMNISGGGLKLNAKNASFDYLAMQFRLAPWMAMSVGLLPYSNVGYTVSDSQTTDNGLAYSRSFTGDGGLHQMYVGAGVKVLKNLSVGVNASYFWGDITRTRGMFYPGTSSYDSYQRKMVTSISDYKLDFGAQYTHQFSKKHVATLGVVFSPGHDLNNDAYVQNQKGNSSTGYTTTQKDTILTMGIPMTLGAGVTYVYDDRLTVGADVMFQKWSSTTFMNNSDVFCNRAKIAVGAEYVPNLLGRSYLSHIKYRLGAYYSKPYYKIDGARAANEYGVTAGFGLPLPRSRSVLSISAQYVRMQGTESRFLNENTLRLCIGVTFNEQWFWKRKVQ